MSKTFTIQPWSKTCILRKEIRERTLTSSDFAIDLHKVTFGTSGPKPYYCDPAHFFSTTYATQNLRQFCKVVLKRLAGEQGGESVINISQTFGGGKSHTLTTLYYLTTLGSTLPKEETSVKMILNDAHIKNPPVARVAAVSFD
jgi:predicted AAA+ superfamily ATPase